MSDDQIVGDAVVDLAESDSGGVDGPSQPNDGLSLPNDRRSQVNDGPSEPNNGSSDKGLTEPLPGDFYEKGADPRLHDIKENLDETSADSEVSRPQCVSKEENDPNENDTCEDDEGDWEYEPYMCGWCYRMKELFREEKETGTLVADSLSNDYDIIHISTLWDHSECVHAAIAEGMDINLPTGDNHWSPLFLACATGKIDSAWVLAEHGADMNWDNGNGQTPLMIAVVKNNLDCAEMLLQYGANVNYRPSGDEGRTALMVSVCCGNAESVRLLVAYGAKFNLYEDDPARSWDRFQIERVYESFSSETLEEILMMVYEQEGGLHGGLLGAMFRKGDPALFRRILDKNLVLKQQWHEHGSPILDPDNARWLLTVLSMFDDLVINLRELLQYEKDGQTFSVTNSKHLTHALSSALGRTANPLSVQLLLDNGADPDGELVCGYRINYILDAIRIGSEDKGGLEIVVLLIKYNCDLTVHSYGERIAPPWGSVELTLQEYALVFQNLYLAQILMLAGMHQCRGKAFINKIDGRDREGYRTITNPHMRCSLEERDDFMKRHLSAPLSLYNLTRVALRKSLGRDPDSRIPQLGLSQVVERFVMYEDLDRIASRYKTAYESLPTNEPV